MQYCSLQYQTLLPSPVTSTTGHCFHFGSISSFFLELFLHSSPVAYWAPTNMGSSSFIVIFFCLFILFMANQQWPQDWKWSVFIPIPKKGSAKECSNYLTIALISHIRKVILRILQARLQQYMNCEVPGVHTGFIKARGTRDQIVNICWIIKKAREFQKNIYFSFIDYAKTFDSVYHNKLWKILKHMGIPDHISAS